LNNSTFVQQLFNNRPTII